MQNVEKEKREEWNERSKISDQETQRKQQEEYIAIKEKNMQLKKTNSSAMRRRIRKAKRKKRNMQDCIALYRPYNENTKKRTQWYIHAEKSSHSLRKFWTVSQNFGSFSILLLLYVLPTSLYTTTFHLTALFGSSSDELCNSSWINCDIASMVVGFHFGTTK